MSFQTSWMCVSRREDALFIFVFSLKLCIVLTNLEFM